MMRVRLRNRRNARIGTRRVNRSMRSQPGTSTCVFSSVSTSAVRLPPDSGPASPNGSPTCTPLEAPPFRRRRSWSLQPCLPERQNISSLRSPSSTTRAPFSNRRMALARVISLIGQTRIPYLSVQEGVDRGFAAANRIRRFRPGTPRVGEPCRERLSSPRKCRLDGRDCNEP